MVEVAATNLEIIVYNWLTRRKIPFEFQTSLAGGFFQLGGAVVDFILYEQMLAWRVMGEYYHKGVEKTGSDITQREMLNSMGYTVVDLLADDLENRPEDTLNLALQGMEMLR